MATVEKTYDITKHSLVPQHSILSEEQITKLLEEYNISKVQLPVIASNDSVVKSLGAVKGNILKIERKGESKTIYYRLVA